MTYFWYGIEASSLGNISISIQSLYYNKCISMYWTIFIVMPRDQMKYWRRRDIINVYINDRRRCFVSPNCFVRVEISYSYTRRVFLYICLYAYSSVYVFLYSWMVNKKILCVSFWYEYFIRWNLCKHNCCASSSNHFRFNAFSLGNYSRKRCTYCHLNKNKMLLRASFPTFRQSIKYR